MYFTAALQRANRWEETLGQAGFRPADRGYEKNGYRLELTGHMLRLEDTAAPPPLSILRGSIDDPGLWKWVRHGQQLRRVFELPLTLLQLENLTDDNNLDESPSLQEWLDWAMTTARAPFPASPATQHAHWREWTESAGLTVQHGAWVRQGRWVVQSGCTALEFPLVLEVPEELPESRWPWLEELLLNAQGRWQFCRFGIMPGSHGREAVVGRVDFTGAPSVPRLILAGLEALKYGTAWLVESAELLTDMRLASQVLAVLPIEPKRRKD